jgi:hypothetical protein
MGWTQDDGREGPYDEYDTESTFNTDSEIIEVFNEDNVDGFSARFGEGRNEVSVADSDYVMTEGGNFREKTESEMFLRDYGMYLGIGAAFLLFKKLA